MKIGRSLNGRIMAHVVDGQTVTAHVSAVTTFDHSTHSTRLTLARIKLRLTRLDSMDLSPGEGGEPSIDPSFSTFLATTIVMYEYVILCTTSIFSSAATDIISKLFYSTNTQ